MTSAGVCPRPRLGRLRRSPRLLAGFEGLTSEEGGKGGNCYKGGKNERKGKERNREEKEEEREGREGEEVCSRNFQLF